MKVKTMTSSSPSVVEDHITQFLNMHPRATIVAISQVVLTNTAEICTTIIYEP